MVKVSHLSFLNALFQMLTDSDGYAILFLMSLDVVNTVQLGQNLI